VLSGALLHPAAVRHLGRVFQTNENMNNWEGLPLTILGFQKWPRCKTPLEIARLICRLPFRFLALRLSRSYPKILVLEYGTDRFGYLRRLVELAPPHIAIITSIGPAHLQGMGSMDRLVQEKATLLSGNPPPRLAILGGDHEYIDVLQAYAKCEVIRVSGAGVELARKIAAIVATHFSLPASVYPWIETLNGPEGRLTECECHGLHVIDDSYNANPLSMKFGLDTLARKIPREQRRVAILGNMAELGEASPQFHKDIGKYAHRCADYVVGVGDLATDYAPDLWFSDSDACAASLNVFIQPGDYVLIKGSASVEMRKISEHLARHGVSAR